MKDATVQTARRQTLAQASDQLHLRLDGLALDHLLSYLDLLQAWNRVYNLTAVRDPDSMLSQHLLDCMTALPGLRRWADDRAGARAAGAQLRALDVGSGGGLPGLVLAICQPNWQVCCVDTVAKKVSFIRQVAAELGLPNVQASHSRVEALSAEERYDVVISRAFASLSDFTALTRHKLAVNGVWAAMKGKPTAQELADLPADVEVFHVEPLQVPGLDAQRCLVWMKLAESAPKPAASP